MLVDAAMLAREARNAGRGVGAFNVILLEQGEAFVDAAEATGHPVILQISENAVKYHGGRLAPLGLAMVALAEEASVPIAVHLDHAEDPRLCFEAIDIGFSSLMYDGSKLPDEENRAMTASIVEAARAAGVSVEAELGEVGGKDGVHAPGVRTDPGDAAKFVADTGVDLLAVAVGSSHAMSTRDAVLDLDLISRIREQVPVPLVLHGSSGVSDDGMQAAIRAGMTKINVSTHLNSVFTHKVREILDAAPEMTDPRKYLGPSTQAMQQEAARLLNLYAL